MEHEAGRTTPLEVVFMPEGLDMFSNAPVDPPAVLASIRALAAAGVTYATLTVPGETRAQLIANIEIFGTEILPEVARALLIRSAQSSGARDARSSQVRRRDATRSSPTPKIVAARSVTPASR